VGILNTRRWAYRSHLVAILFLLTLIILAAGCGSGSAGGPSGLSAEATSPGSILLKWTSDAGAKGYSVQMRIDDEFITLVDLAAGQTSYEDLTVPPETTISYRVQTLTDAGASGGSEASATTPAVKPNPITVQAQFEVGASVSGTIGPDGGRLSATGANGVTYQLELPEGAVEADTAFTLTPVSKIDGWPLDGEMLGAVRIEPEGLLLDAPGWLTYTIANAPAAADMIPTGFAFDGSGKEFHLQKVYGSGSGTESATTAPAVMRGESSGFGSNGRGGRAAATRFISAHTEFVKAGIVPRSMVNNTGSQGVGTVSPGRAAQISKNNAPSNAGAQAQQQQAAQHAANANEEQLAPLPPLKDKEQLAPLPPLKTELLKEGSAIREQIKKADDCQKLQAAINQAAAWEAKSGNQGSEVSSMDGKVIQDLVDKATDLFNKAREKCKKKETGAGASAGCLEAVRGKISKGKGSVYNKMKQKMQSQNGQDYLGNLYGDFKYCTAYSASGGNELSFSGKIAALAEPFSLTGVKSSGTAVFKFTPGGDGMSGSWTYAIAPYEQGSGSYTAAVTDKGGTLQLSGGMTLNVEGISFSKGVSETITLTPVESEGPNVS